MERSAPEYVVALEMGSSGVRCLIAEVTPEHALKVVGVGEQPSTGFERGEISDLARATEDVRAAIRAAESRAALEVETLFAGVGSCQMRAFNSRGCVPITHENRLIGAADRNKALKAAESVFLPADRRVLCAIPQRFFLDHVSPVVNPIGMTASQLEAEVHLVTDTAAMLDNVIRCIQDSGCKLECSGLKAQPEGLLFQPVCAAQAVLTEDERQLGVLFIDFGSRSTDVVFYCGGVPRYSQIFPVGSNHITNDIALGLNLSLREAERVKTTLASATVHAVPREHLDETFDAGLMDAERVGRFTVRNLDEIVEFRVEDTFSLIRRGLERAGLEEYPRAGVVLTGSGAKLRGIVDKAREFFCCPARLGLAHVLSECEGVSGNAAFSAVIGLLQEGLRRRRENRLQPRRPLGLLGRSVVRFGHWVRSTF